MAAGSYRKALTLNIGVIQTTVDLTAVIPSTDRPQAKRLCPEHHIQLKQAHRCPAGHIVDEPILGYSDGDRWRLDDGNKPEIAAAIGMELTPVPVKQLAEHTFDGPSAYWLAPSQETSLQGWHVIRSILAKKKVAFICKGTLRRGSAEKLWRIGLFQDHLIMREIVFPDRIRPHPKVPKVALKRELVALAQQFVETVTDDWKDIDTTDIGTQAVKQWIETLPSVPKQEATEQAADPKQSAADLMEALKAAVEGKKGASK